MSSSLLAAFDQRSARLHDAIGAGMERASAAIDDGRAAALLDRWVQISRSARG